MLKPTDDARWQAGYDAGLREAQRRGLPVLMALVKAAGGCIVVHQHDVEDLPSFVLEMTEDPGSGALRYTIRGKD